MRTITVRVPNPERWWIAQHGDLQLATPKSDPETILPRSWAAIAAAVEAIGRTIAAGGHKVDPQDPDVALIDIDDDGLDKDDVYTVLGWFSGDRPVADPKDLLHDTQHRVWASWQERPHAGVPICSSVLSHLDDQRRLATSGHETDANTAQYIASNLPGQARNVLQHRVSLIHAQTSPRYITALKDLAELDVE